MKRSREGERKATDPPRSPILELRNLTKIYTSRGEEIIAVDHVNLDVERGEIFSLLGPNGAGKTTTFRIIMTLERPTGGSVIVDGYDVEENPGEVRDRVGLVPQGETLYDKLTAEETLEMMGALYSIPENEMWRRIDQLLELVGLEERRYSLVGSFSGGMKQRLSLASGLIHRPGLLLLDEPTTGLDPETRRKLWMLIEELNEEGVTIFINTHNMEEAEALSERVGIMHHGQLLEADTSQNLKRLVSGGEEIEIHLPETDLEAAIRTLSGNDLVRSTVTTDDGLSVTTEDRRRALSTLPQLLSNEGITVSGIKVLEPTLEDVFIELTGGG